jgi:hypothetical protein
LRAKAMQLAESPTSMPATLMVGAAKDDQNSAGGKKSTEPLVVGSGFRL